MQFDIYSHFQTLRKNILFFFCVFCAVFIVALYKGAFLMALLLQPVKLLWPSQSFIFLSPQENFFSHVQVSFWFSVLVILPIFVGQVYAFVRPGLHKRERKIYGWLAVFIPILFYIGVALAFFGFIPRALVFLTTWGTSDWVHFTPSLGGYVPFVLKVSILSGLVLLSPLLVIMAGLVNLVNVSQLRRIRKYMIVVVFVFAAIATPPDPISQIMLAVPLYLLFELSIFVITLIKRKDIQKS